MVSFDIVCLFKIYRLICTQGYFLHPAGETDMQTLKLNNADIYRHMHDDTHPRPHV